MSPLWTCLVSSFLFTLSAAQNNTCDDGCDYDPILQYRPNFARSLPVQILLTGVVLTLVAVLFIHLIFTFQYHWPLAQVNYILQISGVSTLLISLVATLHVVLGQSIRESRSWPYMLSYIAVDIPPLTTDDDDVTWTSLEQATWLVMNATTSGLIQITHIHFLTLLFPSRLEARLIYILVGPLAVVSAIMQLIPIRGIGNQDAKTAAIVNYSDAVRNVCNATLSFLFTASLFVWGFLVNRKQAWRTDGGTAAFGAGALALAIMSTVLNILYIPSQDQYVWLPGLMWAVVLWQSFLGWWWWVGAGMGVGEVEELLKREEKRERKRKLKKERRKEQKEKAKLVWKGVTGAFTYRGKQADKTESEDGDDETVIVEDESFKQEEQAHSGTSIAASREARRALSSSTTIALSSGASSANSIPSPYARASRFLHKWYDVVRLAHLKAARKQAVERVERIQQVYRREEATRAGGDPGTGIGGWGLGSYGIREMEREPKFDQGIGSDGDDQDGRGEKLKPSWEEQNHEGQARHRREHPSDESILEPARIEAAIREERRQPSSMWWWGPLRRWRLQDATVYS